MREEVRKNLEDLGSGVGELRAGMQGLLAKVTVGLGQFWPNFVVPPGGRIGEAGGRGEGGAGEEDGGSGGEAGVAGGGVGEG